MKIKEHTDNMLFLRLLGKISRVSRVHFASIYMCFILGGVLYGVTIKVKQVLFDAAVLYTDNGDGTQYMIGVLLSLLICEILSIITNYAGNFLGENYDIKASGVLKQEVHMKINKLPNIYFEDNKLLDKIDKSYEGISTSIAFVNSLLDMVFMYLPSVLVFGIYLVTVKPILIIVLLLIFIPIVYAQFIKAKTHGNLEEQMAPLRRRLKYYGNAAAGKESFKETRILGSFFYFRRLYNDTLKTMQKLRLRVEVKNNLYELSARLMSLLGYIGILFLLFKLLLNKDISVGVFAAIFSSIGDMYSLIEEAIVSRMGRYAMSYGKIKNYFEFMDLEEEQGRTETVGDGNIVFKNVTFRYPGCEVNALEDIAFTLNQGEKLAVVGANGSGKTTLAKVLTGIYTPVTGTVKSTSFENISQVFQKFQRYKMTLSDNVYISDCDKDKSEEKINISLKKAGININTSTYPEGVDTLLANEFGGVDISGGQWQKIAIARGFYRDSKLIVLDEPTSAIDPVEENAVYNRFEKMIKDKTAVIITHRLGAVRFADKILVMDKGKAVGFGSHDNLLENNSVYKEMWLAQAESYV